MTAMIGEVVRETTDSIVFKDRGAEVVGGLDDLAISQGDHYTDHYEGYAAEAQSVADWLSRHEVRVQAADGSEVPLQAFDDAVEACRAVDEEYGATVTPRLQKITQNPDHHVPQLRPELVYPGYVALQTGGAVVLPTSVGNIVAAASPRGLSTMFAVKERPPSKAGVVLTTMDEIPELAHIPDGWEGYLRHMHSEGILVGSKLLRNNDHPLFKSQPEWSRDNSQFQDGTSMFVSLPGPYSDVVARMLAKDGSILTASSANKSGEGNNRNIDMLHSDIKRGCDFVAWDPEAVTAYPLDEQHESQGIMVDFRPNGDEEGRFHIIRYGFMNGPFITESVAYIRKHPELAVAQMTGDLINIADRSNK
ncbi:MAG TPA: hypothetical protein VD947_04080 [Patescibacteria group bacterium]|nr:hypothetical protein [Patescibacteria group bacterium]